MNTERAQWLRAQALGFLAEHMSKMTEAEKKYKLDRLIAVSLMVGDAAIFRGLALLAGLSPDKKLAMFG